MNTITVTEKTTLGELLSILDLAEKSGKTPTPKELFGTAGDPIAETNDCTLFSNGFAIYQNITGRTVVWLPYCKSFTFYFNKLRDSEKDTFKETYELPDGFLTAQPWILAVTLIGDHRIEANSMNRTGSRKDTTDYDSADNGDKDGDMELAVADPFRRAFNWYDGRMGENPQDAVERRETREKMLEAMTDKQREVFVLYYRDCMTQDEIAEMLGIAKMSVNERLRYALTKAKNFSETPYKTLLPRQYMRGLEKTPNNSGCTVLAARPIYIGRKAAQKGKAYGKQNPEEPLQR